MGKIEVFAKWDLKKSCWIRKPNIGDFGRSFALASFDRIINGNGKINYIIIDNGTRVEDNSKDGSTINEKKRRIDYILDHYKRCNGNYDVKLLLLDADAPIIEDAKLFAEYIEHLH